MFARPRKDVGNATGRQAIIDIGSNSVRFVAYAGSPRVPSALFNEKIMAALMFSSDATHLTNFGQAKAWPVYLMLGNLSKYIRAKPNSGAMYHLAYIPSVRTLIRCMSQLI